MEFILLSRTDLMSEQQRCAGVAKLADVSDLGSDAARHGGSSPSTRTFIHPANLAGFFIPILPALSGLQPFSFMAFYVALQPVLGRHIARHPGLNSL